MKKNNRRNLLLSLLLTALCALPLLSRATPYATSLTNNAGVISFRLNESGFVTVVTTNLAGNLVTNNIGSRNQGLTVTNIGNVGNFTVSVAKTNTPGYASGAALQISVDGTNTTTLATNLLRFNRPQGVAVNKNPGSPLFGRIYVANSVAGTATRSVGDGFYLLNADGTDAVGQGNTARTAGFGTLITNDSDGIFPGRLEVGADDNVYMTRATTNFSLVTDFASFASIFVIDPAATTNSGVITNLVGRVPSSAIVTGSTNTSDLVVYGVDADVAGLNGKRNDIKRWTIGSGPLPYDDQYGTNTVGEALLDVVFTNSLTLICDLARGADGKYYALQFRQVEADANLLVLDPAVDGDANGLADLVWDSRGQTVSVLGQSRDFLWEARGVAISPDNQYMAVINRFNEIWVLPLINGIPDILQRKRVATTPNTEIARDIAFDAAGNIYTASSGQGVVRVYSPGYTTIATSSSQGTFSYTNILPATVVSITGTITNAAEPTTDGEFTFTRTGGDTTQPFSVFYTLGGTATRGLDYQTNAISATNTATLTFPANITTVAVPIVVIDDTLGEVAETVTFTLTANSNYVSGVNVAATVIIADDGDLPVMTITNLGGTYESGIYRPGKFRVNAGGFVASPTTVSGTLSGSAVAGTDYVGPATFSVTFQVGFASTNFTLTPIDNANIAPDKTIIATLDAGAGYSLGATTNATNILRSDDLAALPVLFYENFDTDTSASWSVKTNGGSEAIFSVDYSTNGIPEAPNSTNGGTRGLRLRANVIGAAAVSGVSASPLGQNFGTNYRLRFDLWMNYNGPLPAGGVGGSQFFTAGVGVSEARTNVPTASPSTLPGSSVMVTADGDGGFAEATGDYIIITNGTRITANTNNYPANARDNFNAYYGEFGELAAPAAQLGAFANQTGISPIGSLGFAWHDVILQKQGTTYTWTIDGLTIASVSYPTATVGTNIAVGHMDTTSGQSDVTLMNFSLIDNLRVETLPQSTNASLANLVITPAGTLTPAFSAGVTSYTATNAYTGSPITVTPTAAGFGTTIRVIYAGVTNIVASGSPSPSLNLDAIPLAANTVQVQVTAEDGVTTQLYTVNVTRLVATTSPVMTNSIAGPNLNLSWPISHLGWTLQTQTNSTAVGLGTNWVNVSGSAATNAIVLPWSPADPATFFRLIY